MENKVYREHIDKRTLLQVEGRKNQSIFWNENVKIFTSELLDFNKIQVYLIVQALPLTNY